ncbi:hypothetical protein PUNSTDRAFT_136850 [Punctularia strigosozonata HHB-11173 SS5]|uniref:uncharacterized protein n=1 Tax=Punctularia strigosozonata (strain HHB-11173) TaxID=741275 RepID=UPI00044182C3|nr:uncharacterized protein PUNSTDRAFT_136850 [Punctularia strigosozonata HHB-11173 SS5]EIN06056.1 hypothetical protein PUNSTDRAFT_136850 [Punctularia strigosozonata HHB-11173 SS5]
MPGSRTSPTKSRKEEEVPLSNLADPRGHDYADVDTTLRNDPRDHAEHLDGSDTGTDSDTDDDEFDWEADEDSLSVQKQKTHMKARRGRALWNAFLRLARPLRVTLVGMLGAGALIAPLLVFELRFKNSVARPHVFAWSLWFAITWVAACLTFIVVDLTPRVVVAVIDWFDGDMERMKMQIELLFAVRAWIKLALDISWAWIALSVIRATVKPPGGYWVIINRVMQALFSTGMILLVEKIFLRAVAINFHRKALHDRLAENRFGLKALDRLSQTTPPPSRGVGRYRKGVGHKSPNGSMSALKQFKDDHKELGANPARSEAETPSSLSPMREKGSPSPQQQQQDLRNEGRRRRRKALASIIVDQVGGAIGQIALKDSELNKGADYSGLYSARKLARKLFMQLSDVHPPRNHLLVEDFVPYFGSHAEAQAAFAIFDKDGNGDITKKEMRDAVQRIYRERKALVASLKDVSAAVAKLDAVLIACALVLLLFIYLLIFNRKDTLSSLVPIATIVLGFSFIFGHSAQILFESLIFIFSTHVFDVGDLVFIDDNPLFVKEFGLFSTVFRKVDGTEIIAPNSLMSSSKLVHNMRRSGSMWETTNLQVAYDTPMELIETLRQRLQLYVAQNNRDWSNVAVHIDSMEYQNCITLIIAMEHRPNWQDWGGRWTRRTPFMKHLKQLMEELDLRYTLPVQPIILPRQPPWQNVNAGFHLTPPQGPNRFQMTREEAGNAGSYPTDRMGLAPPGMTISSEPNRFDRL